MEKKKMNGSMDALAQAMCQAFTEVMGAAIEPIKNSVDNLGDSIRKDMVGMESRLNKRIDTTNEYIDTTNKNMSAQFIEQEKKIGTLIKNQGVTS